MKKAYRQTEQHDQKKLIGRGNFVDVYNAEYGPEKRKFFIKQLRSGLSQDDRSVFLEEGRIAMKLDHPHLLKVKVLVSQHRPPYLVLDYDRTYSLFRQHHPVGEVLPLTLIGRYIWQIADALAYMHREGLTHQHLRPENLLISENGDILLADLSIMAFTQQPDAQEIHPFVNAELYMAPELFLGVPEPASDQYSLAVMVYEWFTGRPLLEGAPDEIKRQRINTPPSLHENDQIPFPSKQALLKALARNPAERFDSITAFVAALGM